MLFRYLSGIASNDAHTNNPGTTPSVLGIRQFIGGQNSLSVALCGWFDAVAGLIVRDSAESIEFQSHRWRYRYKKP